MQKIRRYKTFKLKSTHSEKENVEDDFYRVGIVAITNIQNANFALVPKCLVDSPPLTEVVGKMKSIDSMQQRTDDIQH